MPANADQPFVCELGPTGKLIRRALVTRSAPSDFREELRRRLVDARGAGQQPAAWLPHRPSGSRQPSAGSGV